MILTINLKFSDSYAYCVLLFIFTLCFCRQILEVLQCLSQVTLEWFDDTCQYVLPCSYGEKLCTHNALRTTVLMLGLLQPVAVIITPTVAAVYNANYTTPNLFLVTPVWNVTAITSEGKVALDKSSSTYVQTDTIILALPHTILAATALTVLLHVRDGSAQPVWDCELFTNAAFCTYDLLFACQVFFTILVLASTSAYVAEPMFMTSISLTLTACVAFFMAGSRIAPTPGPEQILVVVVFAITATVVCSLWLQTADLSRPSSVLAAATLSAFVLGLNLFHSLCHGEADALTVILVRTMSSVVCTGVMVGIIAAG